MAKSITISFDDESAVGATVDGTRYPVNLTKVTPQALAYVFAYGLQRAVNDRTGGSNKTAEDKIKIANAVVANFYDPAWSPGSRGIGDPLASFRRAVVRAWFKLDKYAKEAKAYKTLKEQALRDEYLDGMIEGFPQKKQEAIENAAVKLAERKQREADEARKLAASADI